MYLEMEQLVIIVKVPTAQEISDDKNQYRLVCMIIVTDRGCNCRKSLLDTCLRYPASFILMTSLKLKKKIQERLLPFPRLRRL